MGHSGYVGLYWGSSCHIYQLIQHCKIHYGKKGTYIRYNRTTYYFD